MWLLNLILLSYSSSLFLEKKYVIPATTTIVNAEPKIINGMLFSPVLGAPARGTSSSSIVIITGVPGIVVGSSIFTVIVLLVGTYSSGILVIVIVTSLEFSDDLSYVYDTGTTVVVLVFGSVTVALLVP